MLRATSNSWAGYAAAIGLIAAAAAIRTPLGLLGATLYFSTFYPAVLLAALYGGWKSGVLATILSLLYGWWAFAPPHYEFGPVTFSESVNFAAFVMSCALIIWVAKRLTDVQKSLTFALGELQHRGRNTFAMVDAIVRQSLPHDREAATTIAARIRAISSTNDLIGTSSDMTADIGDILAEKFTGCPGVTFRGEAVTLSPNVARNLSLLIHELYTNATKHGALKTSEGRVLIQWECGADAFTICWAEHGGPPVTTPSRAGFGTKLIDTLLLGVGGKLERRFERNGLRVNITLPAQRGARLLSPQFNCSDVKKPEQAAPAERA